jgi:3-phenylpropionate/cinnamic acid dioxygenase small subunit
VTAAPAAPDRRAVEDFVFREARLADEHEYAAWERLWTDDGVYWVPAADGDADGRRPLDSVSVIHDNRHRIATRLRQLETGRRYAQVPPSRLRRVVSNLEVLGRVGGDAADAADWVVAANFVLVEARRHRTTTWAGRVTYHLRPVQERGDGEDSGDGDDRLRMSYKKVDLVDREWDLPTLAFLI